jgi:hypothetical protein
VASQFLLGSNGNTLLRVLAVDRGGVLGSGDAVGVDGFGHERGGRRRNVSADDVVNRHRREEAKEPGESIDPIIVSVWSNSKFGTYFQAPPTSKSLAIDFAKPGIKQATGMKNETKLLQFQPPL